MSKPSVLAEPVLVGRERELGELQSFLNSAVEGKGKTVFVSGEAGSGKTRLVTEFLKCAKKQSITILTGWCLSNAAVPYFPFFEAFSTYFTKEQSDQAKDASPSKKETKELKRTWGPQDVDVMSWLMGPNQAEQIQKSQTISPQVWKDQTFVAVAKTLTAISAGKPVILFIDDLHWADSASLALTHYLARATDSVNILLLATYRTEELVTKPEGKINPLVETLRLMRREDLFKEIKIASLNEHDVVLLAQNMLAGRVRKELAADLAEESQGNPLFVVESVRMLHERDDLRCENDEWRLPAGKVGIPDKIRDIILQRLDCLTESQRKALDVASVVGERFTPEVISSVLNLEAADMIETFDKIGRTTALVYCEGELYKFDHARTRDAVYSEISLGQQRVYHAKVAEKLESKGKDGKFPYSDLAYHFAQAKNKEKAIKYSLAAGQDALSKWSNIEATEHFGYVLKEIGDDSRCFTEKTAALDGLGDAYSASNNFKEAAKTFEQLADIQTGVAKLQALRKAMFAAFYLGDIPLLQRLTQKAEENATADRLEAARVLHQKARVKLMQLDVYTCQKMLEEVLKVFEEEYALSDAAWILFANATNTARLKGEFERGVEMALRSIALYDELGDVRSQLEAYLYTAFTFEACALREDAERMYAKIVEVNEQYKMGDYVHLIPAHAYRSMNLSRVDLPRAISMALKALEYSAKTDSTLYIGFIYEVLIREYAVSEEIVRVDEYFGKLMSLPKSVLSSPFSQLYFALTMGVYYAAKNDFEKSNQYFNDEFALNKELGLNPSWEEGIRRLYAWALNRQGRAEEARSELDKAKALVENAQERFRHTNVQASLMTFTHPEVNQPFEVRFDLTNVSKSEGSIVRFENLLVPELKVIDVSPNCFVHDGQVELKDKTVGSFEVKTVKLTVKAEKPEEFHLKPSVKYVDDLGETKTSSTRLFTMTVQPVTLSYEVLPGRVATGSAELDRVLMGGIPEKYAVVLTAPSSDERQLLVKRFLDAGADNQQTTIYLTCETGSAEELAKRYETDFYVGVCNPQAETVLSNLPNIIKLKGTESLTEIDIALTKLLRAIALVPNKPRRICVDLVSDVLLQHHAVNTRRWLSGLLATLKSNGFTTLAVIDPLVLPEEVAAVTGVFNGEIRLAEKETESGPVKTLRVTRLQGQNYLKDEITLG